MPITKEFLLNDGRRMPWLGIGSGSAHHGRDASATIAGALRAGVVHLDTAQMYGNEDSVGAALADAGFRDKIWLTTKLDKLPPGESVLDALRASLARLRVDSVDLFLIHSPLAHDDIPATWRALEDAQRAGLARSIGVSNFRVHELETLLAHANVIPAVNQASFSVTERVLS
jgi:diketogulonate reductase-like aldo/keto reductase